MLTTWQPSGLQWIVMAVAAALASVVAVNTNSPVMAVLMFFVDAALVVWFLETRRRPH